jgi:hypothetical protein
MSPYLYPPGTKWSSNTLLSPVTNHKDATPVKVKVVLRLMISQPVCLDIRDPSRIRDQFSSSFFFNYLQTFVGMLKCGALSDKRSGL